MKNSEPLILKNISEKTIAEFDQFRIISDLKSREELFLNMVALWRWAVKKRAEGKIIGSENMAENTFSEVSLPSLENAKAYAENMLAAQRLIEETRKLKNP